MYLPSSSTKEKQSFLFRLKQKSDILPSLNSGIGQKRMTQNTERVQSISRLNNFYDVSQTKTRNRTKSQDLFAQNENLKSYKFDSLQFIGQKNLSEIKNELQQKIKFPQKSTLKPKYLKRLTVQLLKEFNLIDFKEQVKRTKENKEIKNTFVEIRNENGLLIRRKSIPSLDEMTLSKNRLKVQDQILRKIGFLSEDQQVRHNLKFVKKRKSELKYENATEKQRKQFRRLSKISQSLPKLQHFYSKKANVQYENQFKKKFLT